ncbi:hypothetical protein [Couchioplanes caeruleus]|uniref:hypothetical protein n=1 Tax=Couchioplanes caeruleus TaxID=56438 RepID=UPI001B805698|nr:hypothetical protein [Couchioplanes caeruleus]
MSDVSVSFVQVVSVIAVRDGWVTAAVAMDVIVDVGVGEVLSGATLFPVSLRPAVDVAFVHVVGVIAMPEPDVAALLPVLVVVLGMDLM